MNQTPDMEQYKKLPRLYVAQGAFSPGAALMLPEAQAHYLRNVMRVSPGEFLRVFNGKDGEWLAALQAEGRRGAAAVLDQKISEQKPAPDLWAIVSPVKKEAFEFMLEKGTELGASLFQPVLCDHTVVRRVNEERMASIVTEASEQCERLDLPGIAPLQELEAVLAGWDPRRRILMCLERKKAEPIAKVLQGFASSGPLAVLIGPEGGFSPRETELAARYDFVTPVSLGERILRAETALCAALACVEAFRAG